MRRPSHEGVALPNFWIAVADLFAGLTLFGFAGLVALIPQYRAVKFSRELARTVSIAARVNSQVRMRLESRSATLGTAVSASELSVTIPSAALFDSYGFDDFRRDSSKMRVLREVREAVNEAIASSGEDARLLRVVIEGHTDADSIRRDAQTSQIPTNWELSSRRATGVLRFFLDADTTRRLHSIIAVGKGSTEPVASNETTAGKAQNRRIVIRIEPDLAMIRTSNPSHNSPPDSLER